jgi:hypothetical protein
MEAKHGDGRRRPRRERPSSSSLARGELHAGTRTSTTPGQGHAAPKPCWSSSSPARGESPASMPRTERLPGRGCPADADALQALPGGAFRRRQGKEGCWVAAALCRLFLAAPSGGDRGRRGVGWRQRCSPRVPPGLLERSSTGGRFFFQGEPKYSASKLPFYNFAHTHSHVDSAAWARSLRVHCTLQTTVLSHLQITRVKYVNN